MSNTTHEKTYFMKGIEIVNGDILVKDNIVINDDWKINSEINDNMLVLKYKNIIVGKIYSNSNVINFKTCRFFITDPINIKENLGKIVSSNGNYLNMDLTQSPSINQCFPTVSISKCKNDPTSIGVIIDCENGNREIGDDIFKRVCIQEDEINRVIIGTSGYLSIWITDINGILNNGDYITTSDIKGYGMKQENNINNNYTFGKILQDCNFIPKLRKLQQPIDFDNNGPIYTNYLNSEGKAIEDYEYELKYIDINGDKKSSKEFINDIKRIMNEMNYSSSNISNISDKKLLDSILKNPNRKIYRACLVGIYKQ